MTRGVLVAAVVLAALIPSTPPESNTVDDLLRKRAEAVLTHDEQAFVRDVDPQAVQDQRELFRSLSALPLTTWSYTRDGEDVRLTYALAGVDARPITKTVGHRFARRADRWYLTASARVLPWDFGPLRVATTEGGLVLSHPGDEAFAARVLAELSPAVRAVTEVWGEDWARRVAVVIPHTADELRALVGPVLTDVAGVAISDRPDPPTGQRVVINSQRANELSPLELGVLMKHEITHVAARAATSDRAPAWLLEGFADYVAFRGLPFKQVTPQLTAQVTAPPTDFVGPGRDLAYQQAYSMCLYLAEERGEQGLVDFYRANAKQSTVDIDVAGWREFLAKRIG